MQLPLAAHRRHRVRRDVRVQLTTNNLLGIDANIATAVCLCNSGSQFKCRRAWRPSIRELAMHVACGRPFFGARVNGRKH